ncbi:MAG TPA: Ldh family oxidoreductase [Thermoanaerobaculia bacterium]|nr:Ldh family oxidoreductase [Thermoanaerobaculia bacterium]
MTRVDATRLARIMEGALRRRGLPDEHAGFVVDGLLEASLRGVDTHGVRLFPTYLAELDGGRSRARPEMRWLGSAPAARVLDAGHALGIVAGRVACDEAVRLARENGVGTVAVRNSNHFGPASCYTLAMARQGALGLALTNSDALVAPYNGRLPFFGTNPISLAAAGEGEDTFCADFATSQVSYSRVKRYREEERPLSPGWALTPDGRDAAAASPEDGGTEEVGALQPLGGHKGQCLGMMVEVLSAVLAGMPFDHELSHLYAPPYDEPRRVAHLFIAFHLPAFGDPDGFRQRLSRLMGLVRDQPGVGGERVHVPGDPEIETAAERRQQGIPLSAGEWAWFEAVDREGERECAAPGC